MGGREKSPWWKILIGIAIVVAACTLSFLGVGSFFQSGSAVDAAHATADNDVAQRKAATARINALTTQVNTLQDRVHDDARALGQLATADRALTAQLQTLGVAPVVIVPTPVVVAVPSPRRSATAPVHTPAAPSRPAAPPAASRSPSPVPPPKVAPAPSAAPPATTASTAPAPPTSTRATASLSPSPRATTCLLGLLCLP